MTFSIAAHDPERGDWGVAVASKFPAVGAVVPFARAGAGAVATQAWANVSFGPEALAMMSAGAAADEVLKSLVEGDDGREQRQLGLVDSRGDPSTFTGGKCLDWAGGMTGEGFACQGNILVGPQVIEDMAAAYRTQGEELVDRLLAALQAGDAAGGDRRGRQSAALLVVRSHGGYGGLSDRYVDLRVDDHPQPVAELMRIFSVYDRDYLVRTDSLLPATPALIEEVQRRLRATGHFGGPLSGLLDEETRKAMEDFAGESNLEDRLRSDDLVSEALVREIRDVTPEVS